MIVLSVNSITKDSLAKVKIGIPPLASVRRSKSRDTQRHAKARRVKTVNS